MVVGGAVVTGDGHQVDGRDPATGTALWSYARDLDLCGVTWVYNYAVAVYPDSRGCGQVSTIDARPACAARAAPPTPTRSDAVLRRHHGAVGRRQPAGAVALRHGADAQLRRTRRADQAGRPRPGAVHAVSAAASSTAVSVLEACPEQKDLRLTLLRPADEEDTPDLKYVPQTGVTDDSGARVVAVSDTTTAVYVPTPKPSLNIIDETGSTIASTCCCRAGRHPRRPRSRAGDLITWWTGDA